MMEFVINPNQSVGDVVFGQSRSEVRAVLYGYKEEFKKSRFSKNTTDDFGYCHVFYDKENKCTAIEFFENCKLVYHEKNLFDITKDEIADILPDVYEEYGSYISEKLSIGITFGNEKIETVLIGCKGYYFR